MVEHFQQKFNTPLAPRAGINKLRPIAPASEPGEAKVDLDVPIFADVAEAETADVNMGRKWEGATGNRR